MEYTEALKVIAVQDSGIINNKAALTYGIQRHVLAKLCTNGILQRVARGQYILSDDIQDELFTLGKRSANLMFSHEIALFLHGILRHRNIKDKFVLKGGMLVAAIVGLNNRPTMDLDANPAVFERSTKGHGGAQGTAEHITDVDRWMVVP